jgi:RHS repeat-associated protein
VRPFTACGSTSNGQFDIEHDGTLVARFRYDGEGRRILKMFDTDSPGDPDGLDTYEHLFLSGQQVVETRQGSGTTPAQAESLQPKYQNIWSPRYIDALILRDENTDSDGACDDGRVYALADANFNVTALVDTNGDVVERYLYSPYGEVTILDPDFTADADGASDYANTTLYTGREYDPQTGLMYYRARYYHPHLGRFVSRDPLTVDPNLYRYCGDNPVIYVDPLGLYTLSQDEKDALKECKDKCSTKTMTRKDFEALEKQGTTVTGFVKCSDGKMVVGKGPNADKAFAGMGGAKYGFDQCFIRDHEEHHIAQYTEICPNICKGKNSKDDECVVVSVTTKDCQKLMECAAWYTTLTCIRGKIANAVQKGGQNEAFTALLNAHIGLRSFQCAPKTAQQKENQKFLDQMMDYLRKQGIKVPE